MQRIHPNPGHRGRPVWPFAALALAAALVVSGCGLINPEDQEVATEGAAAAPDVGSSDEDVSDGSGNESQDETSGDDAGDAESTVGEEAEPETQVEQSSTTSSTAPPSINMPNVIGMTEAEARSTLSTLGVEDLAIQTRESFEPAGTVLDQVPSADKIITGSVNLIVAASIQPMPDFVGTKIAEAREWAELREIELRTETQLTDETPPGQIVTQIPEPGAEVSQEIVVTVADAPVIVELAEFGWREDLYGDRGDIEMNGTIFPDTVILNIFRSSTSAWVSYNLSRDWSTLKMELGVSDELDADSIIQIEIKGDSEVLYSDTIGFGALQSVDLDVTDILRLDIIATRVDGRTTKVGLGEARLIGGAATGG